jgi:hypothetical protein
MRHRGVRVDACLRIIAALDDPSLVETELLALLPEDAVIVDSARRFAEHRRRGRAASFEVYDPPAEVRSDGAVIDTRGNVWVRPHFEPLVALPAR